MMDNPHLAKYAKSGGRSFMAYVLQHEEARCLMVLDRAMTERGRSLETLIHDGGFVRKAAGEDTLPDDVLRFCERRILEMLGYELTLKVKPMECHFKFDEDDNIARVPSTELVDDAFAARRFLALHPGQVIMDSGVLYLFDDQTGMWTDKELDFHRKIMGCGKGLKFVQFYTRTSKEVVFNYSGEVRLCRNLYTALTGLAPREDGYFLSRAGTAIGKLLFADGIYDFHNDVFRPGFDPNIIFF